MPENGSRCHALALGKGFRKNIANSDAPRGRAEFAICGADAIFRKGPVGLFHGSVVAPFRRLHLALLDELFDDLVHFRFVDAGGCGHLAGLHGPGEEIQDFLFHGFSGFTDDGLRGVPRSGCLSIS